MDANGDLFGTTDPSTQNGGNTGGVVYEIVRTANGYESTPTIVHDFSGGANGVGLGANLVADASGDLFGTTQTGGVNGTGTAFEITNSGFVPTPSPLPPPTPVPSDFYDDGYSDILLQNTNGQVGIWEMNGTNVTSAAAVGFNPGPSWQEIGTGDFNDDGHSDILLQNTNGAGWDLGNERDQRDQRCCGGLQSRAELEGDRNRRLQRRRPFRHSVAEHEW